MKLDDVRDWNPVDAAYITSRHKTLVVDTFLCWSFSHYERPNPPFMDLFSKQSLQVAFINFHDEPDLQEKLVEIASEKLFLRFE